MRVPTRRGENKIKDDDAYLTPAGIVELKKSLERLKLAQPRAIAEVVRTQAMGDLSENAAYTDAKGKLRGINNRIMELEHQLNRVVPITAGSSDGTVRIGCTVTVLVVGKEKKFTILGSSETDPSSGRISYKSPVGAALMGHAKGEHVWVEANGKKVEYKIVDVR